MELWILIGVVAVLLLLFERQRRARRRLEQVAITDPLTGVPNRYHLEPLLAETMALARRHQKIFALALVDLDHFKDVNDGLGHASGDQILREVVERLRTFWPERYPVLRIGGDEFALVLHPLATLEEVTPMAKRLVEVFAPPFQLGSSQVYLDCSVGVATFPRDADTPAELLRDADWALYRAKREQGSSFEVFRPAMAAWVKRRVELEDELEAALTGEQLDLELQPQVSILSGELVGAEALTRWRHPTLGDIPPSTFIPLAEETGRIPRLGDWVMHRACELAAQWETKHGASVPLSINVSIRQIQAGTLVATVEDALAASGLRPELLRLEITANHAGRHADKVHQCVEALARLGVGFTIDDFGTGYGSLDYLVRSPFRALKIDRRFIAGLPDDRVSASIVSAAIGLGRGLGLEVIASGVEVPEQLEFLRRSRCLLAQGYLLSPPLSRKTFEALLIERRVVPIAPALQRTGS